MPRAKRLTPENLATRKRYLATQAKWLGNLHERMQCVMKLAQERRLWTDNDLWQALWDLALEVSMTEPAEPPFGHRFRSPTKGRP